MYQMAMAFKLSWKSRLICLSYNLAQHESLATLSGPLGRVLVGSNKPKVDDVERPSARMFQHHSDRRCCVFRVSLTGWVAELPGLMRSYCQYVAQRFGFPKVAADLLEVRMVSLWNAQVLNVPSPQALMICALKALNHEAEHEAQSRTSIHET